MQMYGWRARLGILIPSGIMATEPEFNMMVPAGVCCHYTRYRFSGRGDHAGVVKDLHESEKYLTSAVEDICHIEPSAIAMVGTATTFIGGMGYDRKLVGLIGETCGNIPVTTTSTAVLAAFKAMGIRKVSVGMPYFEDVARAAIKFVEDNGFEVVKARWLDKVSRGIWEMSKETLCRLAWEVDEVESEALFISCTNLHTLEVIEKLEVDLGKPVITSNQATMWHLLRLVGVNEKLEGYGRLLYDY